MTGRCLKYKDDVQDFITQIQAPTYAPNINFLIEEINIILNVQEKIKRGLFTATSGNCSVVDLQSL